MVDEELPPLPLNVERLVRVLDDHDVQYVLAGGLGLILYDVTDRQTYDLGRKWRPAFQSTDGKALITREGSPALLLREALLNHLLQMGQSADVQGRHLRLDLTNQMRIDEPRLR